MTRHGLTSFRRTPAALAATESLAPPSSIIDPMHRFSHNQANHLRRTRLPATMIRYLRAHRSSKTRHPGIHRKPQNP